jgi:polar amino acid transport system permease protein
VAYEWRFDVVLQSLPLLLYGLSWSFLLGIAAMIFGSAIGLLVALLRVRPVFLISNLGVAYIELFRNTPVLAQVLWIYYVLPVVAGLRLSAIACAIIAFSLNVGAFMAEIFRAGILSIEKGQREAALAIGLTPAQAFRRVVLPQALQNILPASANIWLSLLKDTSVASVIAVGEMMYVARSLAVNTYRPVEVLTVAGLIYFLAVYVQSIAIEHLYGRWLARSRRHEGGALRPAHSILDVTAGAELVRR